VVYLVDYIVVDALVVHHQIVRRSLDYYDSLTQDSSTSWLRSLSPAVFVRLEILLQNCSRNYNQHYYYDARMRGERGRSMTLVVGGHYTQAEIVLHYCCCCSLLLEHCCMILAGVEDCYYIAVDLVDQHCTEVGEMEHYIVLGDCCCIAAVERCIVLAVELPGECYIVNVVVADRLERYTLVVGVLGQHYNLVEGEHYCIVLVGHCMNLGVVVVEHCTQPEGNCIGLVG